jgi:hypothetical protein
MKLSFVTAAISLALLFVIAPGVAHCNDAASQISAIVDNGEIVIGDASYKVASNAVFYASDERTEISIASFDEGDWVEFSLNSKGEIDEMWLSSE